MSTTRMADGVGKVLGGRYRLMAAVGAGGSAHVYLGDDVTLRRQVAVKVLHTALTSDDRFLRRFRAEAQAVAALNHPNIVRVYDWGEDASGPWIVMEALAGGSLRDLLDGGQTLSPAQAAVVGLEAARALDYAHRRGFVHRDIKPANLLFDDEARLRVADFGLARALAEAALTEPAGAVLGTARYVSPEQVQGSALDGKSDVYSLALVIFEAITGFVPFQSDTTVATLMARLSTPLPKDSRLGPLQDVLDAATVIRPEHRMDTAELVQALTDVIPKLGAPGPLPLAGAKSMNASGVMDIRDLTEMGARPTASDPKLIVIPNNDDPEILPTTTRKPKDLAAPVVERRRPKSPLTRFRLNRKADPDQPLWKVWTYRMMRIVAAIIIGLLLGLGTWQLQRGSVAMPNVVGQNFDSAQVVVHSQKLVIAETNDAFDESAVAGTILQQEVAPGKKVKGYSTIDVTISKGPAPRTVGDYTNAVQADAVGAITTAGLNPVVTAGNSETVEVGRVISQNPPPNTADVVKGSNVELIVSAGPAQRSVGTIEGKSYDTIAAELTAQQLVPARTDVFNDAAAGTVIGIDPAVGALVDRGATVTVTVSRGPDLVTVPNVVGKSPSDAKKALENAGFKVDSFGPKDASDVLVTKPAAGANVKRGSTVQVISA